MRRESMSIPITSYIVYIYIQVDVYRRHVRNIISIDRVHGFLARAFHAIVAAAAGLHASVNYGHYRNII